MNNAARGFWYVWKQTLFIFAPLFGANITHFIFKLHKDFHLEKKMDEKVKQLFKYTNTNHLIVFIFNSHDSM